MDCIKPLSPEPNRLLIVDDDPELLRFLMEELSGVGHHCIGCDNGQDALLAIEDGQPAFRHQRDP